MHEKRKFPRFPVMNPVICSHSGRQMTVQTLDISLGGLKLEVNTDLRVGESMNLAILTGGTRIHCEGRILGIEEFGNKAHARLHFAHTSDLEYRKLSEYLHTIYWGCYQKWIIAGILILSAYIAYLFIYT